MTSLRLLTTVLLLMLSCSPLLAVELYVSPAGGGGGIPGDPTDLQTALNIARTSGGDDTHYLQQGVYDASVVTYTYGTAANDSMAVLLSGGWTSDYSSRSDDPALTALDGGGINRVLELTADANGVDFSFTLDTLTVQNGFFTMGHGAGIYAHNANNGTILLYLDNCLIADNFIPGITFLGGGMYTDCQITVTDTTFSSNMAPLGGAMLIRDYPGGVFALNQTITNCAFNDNRVISEEGHDVYNQASSTFTNCTFTGRDDGTSSSGSGGALFSNAGSSVITHCTFTDIRADKWGSALQFEDCNVDLINCLFANNRSGLAAGCGTIYGLDNGGDPQTITVTNCTFIGNDSDDCDQGGAIYNRGLSLVVTNTIFWDNEDLGIYSESGLAGVSYSLVDGGFSGTGFTDEGDNLDEDPLFASADDFHLQFHSPCLDSGDNNAPLLPATDLDGENRIHDGDGNGSQVVDFGVYEYNGPIPTVTHTPSATPLVTATISPTPTMTGFTPTATVSLVDINLTMPGTYFDTGSTCWLRLEISNPGLPHLVDLYVLLDVLGDYWFYPSWINLSQGLDYYSFTVDAGANEVLELIPEFQMPTVSFFGPLYFYAAMFEEAQLDLDHLASNGSAIEFYLGS